MEREENLNNILNGGGLNNNIDTQMNNISNENSGNGGDMPSIYTVGTTPDVLNRIKGEYCICEFVVGSDTLVTKEGIMYNVGLSYFTLFNPSNNEYIVCDIYAVKFITVPRSNSPNGYTPPNNSRRRR